KLSGRRYRKRDIHDCIDEIDEAVHKYPFLQYVKVTDDAPNCDAGRLEEFLELYVAKGFRAKLEIMQFRADNLTLKMCQLLKKAHTPAICLGVESADPEVFRSIKKGESLEDIARACSYVKSCAIPLILCFVIGLPGATRESDEKSIAFAKEFQPIHCYWNIAQPVPDTQMRDYFVKHGTIYADNVMDCSSLEGDGCFADTPEYQRTERIKMQLKAQATTNDIYKPSVLTKARELGIELEIRAALKEPRARVSKWIPRRW
ncbi:MAG: radical SAM protein, partial [Dehalococcoidia bacterium]|nr:radical SAM protein [Dehalococcoidia bacterium]